MPSYRDYFADVKKRIKEATPEQVQGLLRSDEVQLGDVREKNEWDEGHIVGAVLVRFDGYAILALVVLVVTSALKSSFEVTGTPEPRLAARWVILLFLALATLYSSAWANPVARSIRKATAGFDDLPAGAPARIEFARLHERSRRAMSVAAVLGLLALFLS